MGHILANIISIFHTLVVIFILIAPFSSQAPILLLHVTASLSLISHWYTNNNMCSLSIMESTLRGIKYDDSFTHRFIAPIYDISKSSWMSVSYLITIILMSVSFYNLIYHEQWISMTGCLYEVVNKPDLPFINRMNLIFECMKIIFVMK